MSHRAFYWPVMDGAEDSEGWRCVGRVYYRGKNCRTKYIFTTPGLCMYELPTLDRWSESIKKIPAHKVKWKEFDRTTSSIIANAIHEVLVSKGMPEFRGTPVFQTYSPGDEKVGQRIHIYDAGSHGSLIPVYTWTYSCSLSYLESLLFVLRSEVNSLEIVGQKDVRPPASIDNEKYSWKAVRALIEGLIEQHKFSFYDDRRAAIENTVQKAISFLHPRFVDMLKHDNPSKVLRELERIESVRKSGGYYGRD